MRVQRTGPSVVHTVLDDLFRAHAEIHGHEARTAPPVAALRRAAAWLSPEVSSRAGFRPTGRPTAHGPGATSTEPAIDGEGTGR